jgi:hypothetical protein
MPMRNQVERELLGKGLKATVHGWNTARSQDM